MGGCLTRLQAEMQTPPARDGNWKGLSPQRPEACVPRVYKEKREKDCGNCNCNGAPLRRETQSGIPGLTYDHAGRPV